MSVVLNPEAHPSAEDYSNRLNAYYHPELPYILANEVLNELEKRCGAGQQYTTFPNRITDDEKAKVEAKGYTITENTIESKNRDGAGDLYIGFQVALNATAASGDRLMVISQEESNGITGGGGSSGGDSSTTRGYAYRSVEAGVGVPAPNGTTG